MKRIFSVILAVLMMLPITMSFATHAASTEIYPKISALKISRIYQSDTSASLCTWCSMATIQGYCVGTYTYLGKTNNYRVPGQDYEYGKKQNGDAMTAYLCDNFNGYYNNDNNLNNYPFPMKKEIVSGVTDASLKAIYNQLKQGKPVLVYRNGKSGTGSDNHASVVIAYNGSSSTLEASGFTVLEINKNAAKNSEELYNKYANNPQSNYKVSCYIQLSKWHSNSGGKLIEIYYPKNTPGVEVNYNGNGGTPSQTSGYYVENNVYGDAFPSAVRNGYTFEGWYTTASGGERVYRHSTVTSGNKTLYAHWTENQTGILEYGHVYRIFNEKSGLCLRPNGLSNNSNIIQVDSGSSTDNGEYWRVIYAGDDGYYKLENLNGCKAMDLNADNKYAYRNNLHIYTENENSDAQYFSIIWRDSKAGYSGLYSIHSKNTGRAINVADGSVSSGAALLQWDYHGNSNQQFYFEEITDRKVMCFDNLNNNYIVSPEEEYAHIGSTTPKEHFASLNPNTVTVTLNPSENGIIIKSMKAGTSSDEMRFQTTIQGSYDYDFQELDNSTMELHFTAKSSVSGAKIHFRWGYSQEYESVALTTEWKNYTVTLPRTRTSGSNLHPYVDKICTVEMKDIALYEAGLSGYIGDTDAYTAQAVYGNINDLHSCYMPLPTVQKDGYVFDGWYTKRVGGKKVAEGNSYYDVSGLKGQQKVYAHWIKDSDPAQSIFWEVAPHSTDGEIGLASVHVEVRREGTLIGLGDIPYGAVLELLPGDVVDLSTELVDSTNSDYYGFLCWVDGSGNALSGSKTISLTVGNEDDNKGIYAVYVPLKEEYHIEFSSSGNGSIAYETQAQLTAESEERIAFYEGQDVTFSFIPDEGYVLTAIYLDEEPLPISWNNPLTLSDVRENHTIYVVFEEELLPCPHAEFKESLRQEPTCTEDGMIIFICTECGFCFGETLPSLGHEWNTGVVTKPATCTQSGIRTFTCKNDPSHTRTETIPATCHSYNAAVTAPTCTMQGFTTYTCSNCGSTYKSDYTNALGHSFGAWTDNDENHKRVCSRCPAFETEAHTFREWTVTKNATETEAGEKECFCTVCGKKKTETIKLLTPDPLTLNKTSVTLTYKVDSDTLTANKAVTWRSSDEKVVKVDENGNLTTHKKGTATITATSEDGQTAQCSVTVTYKWWQWLIVIFLFGWIWY